MCGICGVVNKDVGNSVPQELVRSMCDVMVHRGPDDEGFHFDGNVALGMRRLKVIDLETGHQPITSDDGSLVIVFNGEIYNYLELRDELASRGHRFRTASDTEVILRLYEDRGESFLDSMDGMFAIALWDGRRKTLLLARDRLGEKPLHYSVDKGNIVFSSEIKSILCCPEVDREIDSVSVYLYFFRNCVPAPRTIYKNIKKLMPGHYLRFKDGTAETVRYWNLRYDPDHSRTEDDLCEELREVLIRNLKRRMIADVPLGAFLSGGIDSSVVVGLMSSLSNTPVKTFSIGFSEDSYDELKFARLVATRFNTDHHEFVVTPEAISLADKLACYFDEPFGGPSAIPTFIVSQLARKHVTVALTGEGGDEVFAGYIRHVVAMKRRHLLKIPRGIRSLAAQRLANRLRDGSPGKRFLQSACLDEWFLGSLPENWMRRMFAPGFLAEIEGVRIMDSFDSEPAGHAGEFLSKYLYWDTKNYLPDDILVKVDRASMANSLETRTLFLGHEIVEFAARVPSKYKIRNGTTKYLLKRAMRDVIPKDVLQRGKWGFALPIGIWFRNELKDVIRSMVFGQGDDGVFDYSYLKLVLEEHWSGKREHGKLLWCFLMYKLWERQWSGWRPPQQADRNEAVRSS